MFDCVGFDFVVRSCSEFFAKNLFWRKTDKRFYGLALSLILTFFLTSCASTGDSQFPIFEGLGSFSNSSKNSGKKQSGNYRVKRGDTLYSIAWANNLDYRTLAEVNQLTPPYRIYAGQYLRTKLGFFETIGYAFKRKPADKTKLAQKNRSHSKNIFSRKAPEDSRYEVFKPKKQLETRPHYAQSPVVQFKKGTPVKGWKWPSEGRIVQGYSDKPGGNRGVDMTAEYGSPIRAAAKGVVVYSGSGLKGYGQLLLIKHNNSYLSAYAHNKRLLVKEGDSVAVGQQIAEMGRANHGAVRLHFEIRHNGQPVDPMIYLKYTHSVSR